MSKKFIIYILLLTISLNKINNLKSESQISTGAIAGIVSGSVLLAAVVTLIAIYIVKNKPLDKPLSVLGLTEPQAVYKIREFIKDNLKNVPEKELDKINLSNQDIKKFIEKISPSIDDYKSGKITSDQLSSSIRETYNSMKPAESPSLTETDLNFARFEGITGFTIPKKIYTQKDIDNVLDSFRLAKETIFEDIDTEDKFTDVQLNKIVSTLKDSPEWKSMVKSGNFDQTEAQKILDQFDAQGIKNANLDDLNKFFSEKDIKDLANLPSIPQEIFSKYEIMRQKLDTYVGNKDFNNLIDTIKQRIQETDYPLGSKSNVTIEDINRYIQNHSDQFSSLSVNDLQSLQTMIERLAKPSTTETKPLPTITSLLSQKENTIESLKNEIAQWHSKSVDELTKADIEEYFGQFEATPDKLKGLTEDDVKLSLSKTPKTIEPEKKSSEISTPTVPAEPTEPGEKPTEPITQVDKPDPGVSSATTPTTSITEPSEITTRDVSAPEGFTPKSPTTPESTGKTTTIKDILGDIETGVKLKKVTPTTTEEKAPTGLERITSRRSAIQTEDDDESGIEDVPTTESPAIAAKPTEKISTKPAKQVTVQTTEVDPAASLEAQLQAGAKGLKPATKPSETITSSTQPFGLSIGKSQTGLTETEVGKLDFAQLSKIPQVNMNSLGSATHIEIDGKVFNFNPETHIIGSQVTNPDLIKDIRAGEGFNSLYKLPISSDHPAITYSHVEPVALPKSEPIYKPASLTPEAI